MPRMRSLVAADWPGQEAVGPSADDRVQLVQFMDSMPIGQKKGPPQAGPLPPIQFW